MSEIDESDIGLVQRPVQNADAQIQICQVGRGSEAGIVAVTRMERFRLSLDPELRDSWREIGLAPFALKGDYLGFRQYLYGAVVGGGMSSEEMSVYMALIHGRYKAWRKQMHVEIVDICHEICNQTGTFAGLAESKRRNWKTVKALFLEGISEYSRINRMHLKYIR